MSTYTVTGLSSGIDYDTLISQLVDTYRQRHIEPLENKKSDYEDKLTDYTTLESKLDALKSAANTLRKASTFDVRLAEVDDSTVLSATASSSALTGSYIISDITALAQAHKITSSSGVADQDTTVVLSSGGVFQFTVNSTTTTVTASSDLTLEDLVSEINSADGGVTATIINDGDASTPYRLVLTSDTTGASGGITINQDDSTFNMDAGYTQLQAAQDASFKVDNLSITKSSNTVTDVINGVTFTLKKATGTGNSYTLTVRNDVDTIKSNIETFINAYNEVISYIDENDDYDTENNEAEPLYDETTTQSIIRRLRTIITSGISGLSADTKILAQVGVETNRDGTLTLDTGVLTTKLSSDYNDVKALFIYDSDTGIEGVADQMYDEVDDLTDFVDGAVTIRKEGIQTTIDDYTDEIREAEDDLDAYEQSLILKFASLESLLSTLSNQSSFLTGVFNSNSGS